jgi:hypothetical protein
MIWNGRLDTVNFTGLSLVLDVLNLHGGGV